MNSLTQYSRRTALLPAVLCTAVSSQLRADDPADTGGVIEGTVTYRADAKRPWRYSRYYVKHAKTGELAEAVVALRSRALSGVGEREPQSVTIDQKNFQFVPETVIVRVGDSVTFTNSDDALHNVRASNKFANFNINIPSRGSQSVKCDKAGGTRDPIQIGCVFHSQMQAWVFVFDHPFYALTDAEGRFRLEGIPPGQYDLDVVHPAGGLRSRQKIDVPAETTQRVDISVSPDDKK